jgi:hypothetical protein
MESSNEAKNETEISNIEAAWKNTAFDLSTHSKGGEDISLLRNTDDVKLLLED